MPSAAQLVETLEPPQRAAIQIVKIALDCFNSRDGTGLFSGVARYAVLAGRVEISAVQANNLTRFWAILLRRMSWPVPPKKADQAIVAALSAPDGRAVLMRLATETASIVSLARMLHDADKATRRAWQEPEEELANEAAADPSLNDDMPI
ncbi:MAG TPA: hypothetical protein VIF61_00475 [Methylocystis sp.]|jgi:hypothetical protein